MTSKQMCRAMRKHGISVVFLKSDDHLDSDYWYAGDARRGVFPQVHVSVRNPRSAHRTHLSNTPEGAVEDYCNARNLEWDV